MLLIIIQISISLLIHIHIPVLLDFANTVKRLLLRVNKKDTYYENTQI